MVRRIFGLMRDEITGGYRKNIRRMRWSVLAAGIGEKKHAYKVFDRNA
jgi:hypothetical protein